MHKEKKAEFEQGVRCEVFNVKCCVFFRVSVALDVKFSTGTDIILLFLTQQFVVLRS
jgi:hypothetical protein